MSNIAQNLILVTIFFSTYGCDHATETAKDDSLWQLDLTGLTLVASADWYEIERWKYDDMEDGGITNGEDTLKLSISSYSTVSFVDEEIEQHLYSLVVINGMRAIIKKPKVPGQGTIGVSFKDAHECRDALRFKNVMDVTLAGHNITNENPVLEIFKTIELFGLNKCAGEVLSDTTINYGLSDFIFRSGENILDDFYNEYYFTTPGN